MAVYLKNPYFIVQFACIYQGTGMTGFFNYSRIRSYTSRSQRIVAVYVILSALWITFSDTMISLLRLEPDTAVYFSISKGYFFIIVTALLLNQLIRRAILIEQRERKKLEAAERSLTISLREKDSLLRELYHRTKNNMQVICSLLSLKAMYIKDRQMTVTLEEMVRRIETMSLVHQMLYKTNNLSRVDLKEYIASLSELISRSYNELSRKVKLTLELESINVLFDTAIPCGLIINEILTNSYKYAFPDSSAGEIIIRLSQTDNGMISLELSDNGIGLKPDSYISDTLGMKLIRGIAEDQLKGTLTLIQQKGVCYSLHFKDELYNERV